MPMGMAAKSLQFDGASFLIWFTVNDGTVVHILLVVCRGNVHVFIDNPNGVQRCTVKPRFTNLIRS